MWSRAGARRSQGGSELGLTDSGRRGVSCSRTPAMSSAGHDPASLLRADRRLRELARQLVRDPGAAEDLAQETWLAALASGEIRFLPGWLATVVRRLSRDERRGAKRRERRERVVARPEALPATSELLAREEARRRVVEALRSAERRVGRGRRC